MSDRISRPQMFMEIAQIVARRSTCTRAQVGAMVVMEGRIISTGYNGSPAGAIHCLDAGCQIGPSGGCTRTIHAEANAVAFAARYGIPVEGATMYCTHNPCRECAKIIINSGIKTVVYEKPYRSREGIDLMEKSGIECFYYYGSEEN